MFEEKNEANKLLRDRLLELAGMLKERKKGTWKDLKKIMARFALQEGVHRNTAYRYLQDLKSAGLVVVFKGAKNWVYNPEEEWDLFEVPVNRLARRR